MATQTITFDITGSIQVSGAWYRVAYDPDAHRVYSCTGVGPGVPEPIYRSIHPSVEVPTDTVPDSLDKWVRKHAALWVRVAEAYAAHEESGDDADLERWMDANDFLFAAVRDAIGEEIARYWSASDWCQGDPGTVVDDALEAGTMERAVEVELERARDEGVLIARDDMDETIRRLVEDARETLIEESGEGDDLAAADPESARRLAAMVKLLTS